jgi:DNA-binding winged helix-turn-helix (wHTH) protein
MEQASISASRVDALDAEADSGAAISALADQQLRQRLELIIRALSAEALVRLETGRAWSFGPFQLFPSRRLLLEGSRKVQIGSRAFDLLSLLVERAGEVVGKNELIHRAWPNVFVHDGNLKTQLSALRRILGEGQLGRRYIATIPGCGYSFVAPVGLADGRTQHNPQSLLPWPTNMFGEPATIAELYAGLVPLSGSAQVRAKQRRPRCCPSER